MFLCIMSLHSVSRLSPSPLPRQQFCSYRPFQPDPVSICRILAFKVPIIWPVLFPCWTLFPEEGSCGTLSQVLPSQSRVLSLSLKKFSHIMTCGQCLISLNNSEKVPKSENHNISSVFRAENLRGCFDRALKYSLNM